ncbi:MAG: helix-turn-helix transcriptional regulator [Actinomycetota bacterium]|nr:helix-turn-helix transcriptional regulator [Actinomycetota bacterium]
MKLDVPVRGHLDAMLLAVVGSGSEHGYAIIEKLRVRSGGTFALPEGSVYPALHRLEQEGLLSSRWALVSGRRRRVYELTRRGRVQLGERRRAWGEFAAAVDAVLEGSAWAAAT